MYVNMIMVFREEKLKRNHPKTGDACERAAPPFTWMELLDPT
jgi:hypothetical protein